jgi:hypothetical protein
LRFVSSTFSRTDISYMKYLITLLYKKCWDVTEVRQYIRRFLFDDDSVENLEPKRLLEILNELAAVCLGETDDLPPPP